LEEIGVHELSLRYLARRAGVSEAAPSHHFAGKEGLLAAIAADGFRDLAALRAAIAVSDETALSKAYRMMKVYVEFAQRYKGLFELMVGPRIVARDSYPELNMETTKSFGLFASSVEQFALEKHWEEQSLGLVTHAAWRSHASPRSRAFNRSGGGVLNQHVPQCGCSRRVKPRRGHEACS
jgi:AcrR family transcriptional regulator